jgi:glycosyltransferase involved in cell wall biosynthesis
MDNKLVFIGPMNLGKIPTAGDSVKNQLFLDRFVQVFDKLYTIDTADWKKNPFILIKLVGTILVHPHAKVIISANPGSADKLIRIIKMIGFHNDFFYWVVGGSFHTMIEKGIFSAKNYAFLKGIFVQGQSMVDSLRHSGLNNAIYVPNSKSINHYGKKEPKKDCKTHFVFLSRVEEYKGCTDIINAVDCLNQCGYSGKFDVVFYGRESEDTAYMKQFNEMVAVREDVEYRGLLNLRDTNNYDELAKYDVMLFPTYWHGEGFPGIVIDAYISSLPIIASDWNLNKDVIEEGQTGWIIPSHDVGALIEKMKYVIDNSKEVQRVSAICRERAAQYDSRLVLSEENLKKLGVLSC